MEQNEEVLIRVYQEKERQYKLQVDELKQKLHNVQQGESALRKQLRQSDDVRQQLQKSVQHLNDEKMEMQHKCAQIERELTQLRNRLDEQRPCDSCRRGPHTQQNQSVYENNGMNKPVPAPRLVNKVILFNDCCYVLIE
jgi:septal ring factor EnvC (AmiA/AmiB activator)